MAPPSAIWTLLALYVFALGVKAQLFATNASLPQGSGDAPIFLYYGPNGTMPKNYSVEVTGAVGGQGTGISDSISHALNITGPVEIITPDNFDSAVVGQIALISCDNETYYQGNIDSRTLVELALSKIYGQSGQHGAVILYTRTSTWCSYAVVGGVVYTMVNPSQASQLITVLDPRGSSNQTGSIAANSSSSSSAPSGGDSSGPGDSNGQPSSTTIAMIVLYSITGIITTLFLLVVLLGAWRAQRHPERYGPRNILGMPRQSRARGMARAMLDTIPIVRFGEEESAKQAEPAASRDVEMADRSSTQEEAKPTNIGTTEVGTTETSSTPAPAVAAGSNDAHPPLSATAETAHTSKALPTKALADNIEAQEVIRALGDGSAPPPAEVPGASTIQVEPTPAHASEEATEGILSCPICTEDFVRGEEARLLPCQHHFHPACIDPWLLKVSSTCPMCRIDLNPPEETAADAGNAEGEAGTSSQPAPVTNARQWPYDRPRNLSGRRRVMMSGLGFLSLANMSHASPEERLQALQQIRAARQAATREQGGAQEQQPSSPRESTMLRLSRTFHRHSRGEEAPASDAARANSSSDAPAPPATTSQPSQVSRHISRLLSGRY